VLLVAPPPLGALPFGALTDGHEPLAARLALAWLPSVASAAAGLTRGPAPGPRHALVLGEPSRLPHAGDEAEAVAHAAGDAAVLRLGPAASVDTLQREAPAAGLIHLACHAQFRADSPRFSALHLHDGALTAEQVEALALRAAPVVVLSACDTAGQAGTGPAEDQGDEWLGLVRAFLVAGASRVLASQWPVDDAVTRGFMARFHQALAAGAPPSAALAAAQNAVRAEHPHPFHWAAFALYGGW
jgi:CHAT domain-containing protein